MKRILVLNSGSSSIKYKLFELQSGGLRAVAGETIAEVHDYAAAFNTIYEELIAKQLIASAEDIDAYGHRVVHGGEAFSDAVLVDEQVLRTIEELIPLAPLHNPSNLEGIKKAMEKSGGKPQVAVFDTAFHQTMPKKSYLYPIPKEFYERDRVRRYGFHGTSHKYVAAKAAEYLNKPLETLNIISLHLGNGASVCAMKEGKSIDTSMGFTPLEGLMMGSRSGDIDPSIIFFMYKQGRSIHELEKKFNLGSGLKGVCGKSNVKEILKDLEAGSEDAKLALDMFCYRVKKYVGAYREVLGEVDAIICTGGIGENSAFIRQHALNGVDIDKNFVQQRDTREIQQSSRKEKILVIPTDEEFEIAKEVWQLLQKAR